MTMPAQYRVASRSMKDAESSSFLLQRDSITFRIDVTSRAEDRSRIACARDSDGADPIPPFGFRETRRATVSFRREMPQRIAADLSKIRQKRRTSLDPRRAAFRRRRRRRYRARLSKFGRECVRARIASPGDACRMRRY